MILARQIGNPSAEQDQTLMELNIGFLAHNYKNVGWVRSFHGQLPCYRENSPLHAVIWNAAYPVVSPSPFMLWPKERRI